MGGARAHTKVGWSAERGGEPGEAHLEPLEHRVAQPLEGVEELGLGHSVDAPLDPDMCLAVAVVGDATAAWSAARATDPTATADPAATDALICAILAAEIALPVDVDEHLGSRGMANEGGAFVDAYLSVLGRLRDRARARAQRSIDAGWAEAGPHEVGPGEGGSGKRACIPGPRGASTRSPRQGCFGASGGGRGGRRGRTRGEARSLAPHARPTPGSSAPRGCGFARRCTSSHGVARRPRPRSAPPHCESTPRRHRPSRAPPRRAPPTAWRRRHRRQRQPGRQSSGQGTAGHARSGGRVRQPEGRHAERGVAARPRTGAVWPGARRSPHARAATWPRARTCVCIQVRMRACRK